MTANKLHVSVSRIFEIDFELPSTQCVNAPPPHGGNALVSDNRLSTPERWTLRFDLDDAVTVAETLNAIADKIVQLVKEHPPK